MLKVRFGWKADVPSAMVSAMVALFASCLVLAGATSAPLSATAGRVEARAVLPGEKLSKDRYVRYYLRTTITSDADLPFTTSGSFTLPAPRKVWLGIYVQTPSIWTTSPPGVRVVERREQFPEFVHGGCQVVNMVADADTGATLASWCNVDDGPPVNGRPRAIPTYFAPNSPFR